MDDKGQIKKTGINMLSGGAGYLLPMLINFLATPFLLEKLGKEAFGLQSLVNVILGYLMVADMGLDVPITKFIAEFNAKHDYVSRDKLLNSTFQLYISIGLVGMTIIFVVEPYLYNLFRIPDSLKDEARIVFWITGIGFFGNIISLWGKAVFIGLQRYEIANGIYIACNLISTIVGIVFVYNDLGLVYFVLAKVTGFFLSTLLYLIIGKLTFKDYKFSFGFEREMLNKIKPLIGYGFVLRISGMIFSRLDQSLISAWMGIGAVAIYSIPYLINMALMGFVSGIMNFTFPRVSELYSTGRIDELNRLFKTTTKYTSVIASYFFSFLIVAGDRFVYLWIDADFAAQSQQTLLILSIAYFIALTFSAIMNNFVVSMNGMGFYTVYSLTRGLVMALGFITLIKPLGLLGAALGVLIAGLGDVAYFFISLKKYIRIDFGSIAIECFGKPILIGVASGALVYLNKLLIVDWLSFVLFGIGYTILYLIFAIVFKLFGRMEKEIILKVLRKINPGFIS